MIKFGKFSQYAVACLTCLAEVYHQRDSKLSSSEISRRIQLPQPTVSKTMNALVIAGFAQSSHGPHGGFSLARHPSDICLIEIVRIFEKCDGLPCCYKSQKHSHTCLHPLHNSLSAISESLESLFKEKTLEALIESKTAALKSERASL
ncbi:Rrf2 family transcriptional regulator [Pelagicoccus enzymogenes]|uniref:RrF2 family transcriptional regulator n=1 Tax=Pelagicoccus enzymogenes TaxID=2773457 RepID=UPI00280FBC42|nr:Rrf2 family transcriptional regulator [Pelagicoccus enzymogenes]MDQ8200274.1 Rrf2 family transcriptional regulator [Pelagicoccus enzymogenes]